MPTLTMNFEAGTTGEVEFICRYFRFETVGGSEISAPFSQIEPIVANTVTADLVSGEDPDAVPNPWSYIVKIRVDGQREFVMFMQMPMTNVNFVDVAQVSDVVNPEYFVLKSDYLDHVDSGGGGGVTSHGDLDDLDVPADHPWAALDSDLDAEVTARIADVDAEQTRATAAEDALDGRLDTVEAALPLKAPLASPALTGNPTAPTATPGDNDTTIATTAFVTDAVATETAARVTDVNAEETARIADVDAEESRALAAEALLAPKASPVFTGNPTAPTPPAADNDTSVPTTAWVQTELGSYAPKASPALTGNPTAPTASQGDNDTTIATTAFVQTELGLYIPKSLADNKGDLIIATADNTFAKHAVGSNGTFLVANSANSDGWENRALAYTDMWTLPRCTVASGSQTITTGTGGEIINTSVVESVDTHGFHSDVTNPSRVTIPTGLGGTYLSMPKFSWASIAGATGFRRVNIVVNGSTVNTVYVLGPVSNSALNFGCTLILTLSAGDYMEVEVVHTQGSDVSGTLTEWTSIRIGP